MVDKFFKVEEEDLTIERTHETAHRSTDQTSHFLKNVGQHLLIVII